MILGSFSFLFHLGLILKIYIAKITINFIEIKKFINTLLSFFFFLPFPWPLPRHMDVHRVLL